MRPLLLGVGFLGLTLLTGGVARPAFAKTKTFDQDRFSFSFSYEDTWIPRVNQDGESVTFALEAGEILISVERARNPQRFKTTEELADGIVKGLKDRVVFDSIGTKPSRIAGEDATLIYGKGRLFDDPSQPYRAAIYVVQHEGRFYVVKYTGYYDSTDTEYKRFESMITTLRFKARAQID